VLFSFFSQVNFSTGSYNLFGKDENPLENSISKFLFIAGIPSVILAEQNKNLFRSAALL
jgi:hypothetical protein